MKPQLVPTNHTHALWLISLFTALSFIRVVWVRDGVWDDNCWQLSAYATNGLREFFHAGIWQAQRPGFGLFVYGLFGLHRHTDYFYVVWHALNVLTQVGTPFFVYFLVRGLFPQRPLLALYAAIALAVFPLDYTLPYASAGNYRLGLLFAVASLYLSFRSVEDGRLRGLTASAAVIIAAISYYLFMEAAVTLEPARWLILGIMGRRHGLREQQLWRRLALWSSPYILIFLPLLIVKLTFKPYGIYEGIYNLDPLFFLRLWDIAKAAGHFLFVSWALLLLREFESITVVAGAMGLVGGLAAWMLYRNIAHSSWLQNHEAQIKSSKTEKMLILLVAFAMFIPPLLMFHAFSRPVSWGINSTHAILLQPGYALFIGWLLERSHVYATRHRRNLSLCAFLIGLWVGAGVFFNNVNLDAYRHSTREQNKFWSAFLNRFPSLPERADFFFDVKERSLYTDLENRYDFELFLNMLYARSDIPAEFRKYRVYTIDEFERARHAGKLATTDAVIHRVTHFGPETLSVTDLIAIRYRDGELLVNDEVLKAVPDISYRAWARKAPPVLRPTINENPYVFRNKVSIR
jgi:hypothetical protein